MEHAHCLVERPLEVLNSIGRVKTGGFHRLVGEGCGADAGKAAFRSPGLMWPIFSFAAADARPIGRAWPLPPSETPEWSTPRSRQLPANGRHHDERPQNGQHGSEQILGAGGQAPSARTDRRSAAPSAYRCGCGHRNPRSAPAYGGNRSRRMSASTRMPKVWP